MSQSQSQSQDSHVIKKPKGPGARAPVFGAYTLEPGTFDEYFEADGQPRHCVAAVVDMFDARGRGDFSRMQRLADTAFHKGGITFSVYHDPRGVEKTFPFDLIPRVVPSGEWEKMERGLLQRVTALDCFLDDVYGDQRIFAEVPGLRETVLGCSGYLPQIIGIKPCGGVRIHVAGVDLVRGPSGEYVVLEDNLRVPSGVSYVVENRAIVKRFLPGIFRNMRIRPVDEYPVRLRDALLSIAPRERGRLVVLTPGPHNSAYFEHSFLARRMGCDLAEGRDLFVHKDHVYLKTTHGPVPVNVIYRRVDDEFLDPEVFRKDSLLGVPGLLRALAQGRVTIANALGNGVADNKAVYPFVPRMIRYYLGEEPLLGQVETFRCAEPDHLRHVLARLPELVVKEVDGSGGYGMLIGPSASRTEIEAFAKQLEAHPTRYIAQPLISLSTCPSWTGEDVAPRRVDLRPYVVSGRWRWVLPGGLTRVALREGSFVVNSSQGGGSKDTWVLQGAEEGR